MAETPYEVDGRRGHQWVTSIVGYLQWRSGAAWRPVSDRWHPERITYLCAAYLVQSAQNLPDPPARERIRRLRRAA